LVIALLPTHTAFVAMHQIMNWEQHMATSSLILEGRGSQGLRTPAFPAWRDNLAGLIGLLLLSAVVSAVVAAVAVRMSSSAGEQFGWQWVALWLVALATILITGRGAFALGNLVAPGMARVLERRRREREDRRFLDSARLDPRLMADIDGAIRRSEWN
jgi:hypothetical protein